jgi:hypothetical protein
MIVVLLILLYAALLECSSDVTVLNDRILEQPDAQNIRPSVRFDDLCMQLHAYIGKYLNDPFGSLWYLNRTSRANFKYYLKFHVNEIFDIPEILSAEHDEPEFLGRLSLTWSRRNRFIFFSSLMEEIINGKKKYQVLLKPLLSYLYRTFITLNTLEQNEYKEFLSKKYHIDSFEHYFAYFVLNNGQYELIIKNMVRNPSQVDLYFSSVENKKSLLEFFESNPQLVPQYLNCFKSQEFYYSNLSAISWIIECIVSDAPEEFYLDLLYSDQEYFQEMVPDLFFSLDIPESKYPHIHAHMRYLFSKCLQSDNSELMNLMNDVRFGGSNEPAQNIDEIDFIKYLQPEELHKIAIASIAANKLQVFLNIYLQNLDQQDDLLDQIMGKYSRDAYKETEKFKVIIDLIDERPHILRMTHHFEFMCQSSVFYPLILFVTSSYLCHSRRT